MLHPRGGHKRLRHAHTTRIDNILLYILVSRVSFSLYLVILFPYVSSVSFLNCVHPIDDLMALLPDIINAESEALNESNNSHVLPVTIDDDSIIFDDFADMDVSSAFWMEIVDMVNTNTRYTTPLIIVGGCVGNLMAVYVFSQTKLWRQSSNYYLSALCLSDTLFLLLTGLLYLTTYQHVNVYNRPGLCEAITYFSSLASFISVWLVVSFTAERYVAVAHPLRRANWCTSSRALHVLSTCVVVGATVNLPLLYFSDMVPNEVLNHTVCGVQKHKKVNDCIHCLPFLSYVSHESNVLFCKQDKLRMFNFIDMVCVFLLPMLLIIVFNTFIALRVWNDARVRGSMTSQHQTRMYDDYICYLLTEHSLKWCNAQGTQQ